MKNLHTIETDLIKHKSVLIFEGTHLSINPLKNYLADKKYSVFKTCSIDIALSLILDSKLDIIIIDHSVADDKIAHISETLRAHFTGYIMVLSTNQNEVMQIESIEAGMDDYLVRPFSFDLLEARLGALTRRESHQQNDEQVIKIQVGDVTLYPFTQKCQVKDASLHLSTFEFRLLRLLLANVGKIMSRDSIYTMLLGREYNGAERTVDVRVSKLRDKLASIGVEHAKIETVWGKGYILNEVEIVA
jgi:DNA-binding response OmpR family regulator